MARTTYVVFTGLAPAVAASERQARKAKRDGYYATTLQHWQAELAAYGTHEIRVGRKWFTVTSSAAEWADLRNLVADIRQAK